MPDQTGVPWESGEKSLPGALFDPGLHSSYLFPRHDWQPPAADLLQQELPQYQDITFMARGGMGAVYRGSQKSLHRSVAIKVLPPEISQVEFGFPERFRREAEAMAQQLRNVGPNGRKLSFMPHYSQLAHSPATRETWKPPVPHASGMGVGKPVLLEFVAIGRGTYGMVEGQFLPPILSDEPSDKGGILIGSQDGEFRDIEVMILDGIPEEKALELAGVKPAP